MKLSRFPFSASLLFSLSFCLSNPSAAAEPLLPAGSVQVAANEPAELEVETPTSHVRFNRETAPDVVTWAVEGVESVAVDHLDEGEIRVPLNPGVGCLALNRSGMIPILRPVTIEAGIDVSLTDLEWRPGPIVVGSVVDSQALPLPSLITIAQEARAQSKENETCRAALFALGIHEIRSESTGHFRSAPLPPGRYLVTVEAADHASFEKSVVIPEEIAHHDLGEITLEAVARVEIRIDSAEVDVDPPYELAVEVFLPREIKQSESWRRVFEQEVAADTTVEVELTPGTHRLTLKKTDSSFSFTTLEELQPGFQHIRLRPEPIFIEGEVTADGLPVENAEVKAMWENTHITASTDSEGEYSLTVWTPAHFGFFVSAPDGGTQFDALDLREAEPGETHELDFDLSRAEISGVVVAAKDQSPIEGCSVVIEHRSKDSGGTRKTTTAADGSFRFEGVTEAESVNLQAWAKGYLLTKTELNFVGEDLTGIWVELDESNLVHGKVVGPAGEPVANINVGCFAPGMEGDYTAMVETRLDGSFEIDTRAGEVLFAYAPGYSLGWAVALEGEETVLALQRLPPPTRVRIVGEGGDPAPMLGFSYVTQRGVVIPTSLVFRHSYVNGLSRTTDAEGVIEISSVPPGVYEIYGGSGGEMRPLGVLPIPSSGEVTLRLGPEKRAGNRPGDADNSDEKPIRKTPVGAKTPSQQFTR